MSSLRTLDVVLAAHTIIVGKARTMGLRIDKEIRYTQTLHIFMLNDDEFDIFLLLVMTTRDN
jgi:hypothetical protein